MPVGTTILRVTATDADSGNFAVIEYGLGNGEGKFAINPTTVSGRWRAWVWGVESGGGSRASETGKPPKGLQSFPHFWVLPPAHVGPQRFLAKTASPVLQVPNILQTVAFLSSRCERNWPKSFRTSSLWDTNF